MTFSGCEDSGLQIGKGAANNTVLNCDSDFTADASLENADGFAAKLDVGSGNKFVGGPRLEQPGRRVERLSARRRQRQRRRGGGRRQRV